MPSVADDDLADAHRHRMPEDRAVVDEGVEFAVFAAGIDSGREVAEEGFVVASAGEARAHFSFDAGERYALKPMEMTS